MPPSQVLLIELREYKRILMSYLIIIMLIFQTVSFQVIFDFNKESDIENWKNNKFPKVPGDETYVAFP